LVALLVGLAIAGQRFWRFATERVEILQSLTPLALAVLQWAHFLSVARTVVLAATGLALALYGLA
jgi:hypothetical protein